jgi:hypothetical protein
MAFPKANHSLLCSRLFCAGTYNMRKKPEAGQFESSVRLFAIDPKAAPKSSPMDAPSAMLCRAAPIAAPKLSPTATPKPKELFLFDIVKDILPVEWDEPTPENLVRLETLANKIYRWIVY